MLPINARVIVIKKLVTARRFICVVVKLWEGYCEGGGSLHLDRRYYHLLSHFVSKISTEQYYMIDSIDGILDRSSYRSSACLLVTEFAPLVVLLARVFMEHTP